LPFAAKNYNGWVSGPQVYNFGTTGNVTARFVKSQQCTSITNPIWDSFDWTQNIPGGSSANFMLGEFTGNGGVPDGWFGAVYVFGDTGTKPSAVSSNTSYSVAGAAGAYVGYSYD